MGRVVKILLLSLSLCSVSQAFGQVYIFVSYSMNESALEAYFKQAQREGAQLVMRGLLNDSFQETKAKCDALSISYTIDPKLFEQYKVKVVPTIVKEEKDGAQKVTGHISLREALKVFGRAL